MMVGQPGRKPGCFPKILCNWVTRSWLVLRICSSEGRGMVQFFPATWLIGFLGANELQNPRGFILYLSAEE